MRYTKVRAMRFAWQSLKLSSKMVVGLAGLMLSGTAAADDLELVDEYVDAIR